MSPSRSSVSRRRVRSSDRHRSPNCSRRVRAPWTWSWTKAISTSLARSTTAAPQPLAPGISQLLARAEAALAAGNCQEYYDNFMSPNFNRATSKSAKKTLLNACSNNENTRETMITTLRIVQELQPRYDLNGTRAIYDVSGQGLPYERFVIEREGDRWFIAE